MIWAFIKSGAGKIVGIAVLVLAALGLARQSGKKAAENKRKVADLEAEKKTRERMDNAKPAENVDDARDNLNDWLHPDD
jgi:hypothetical protein